VSAASNRALTQAASATAVAMAIFAFFMSFLFMFGLFQPARKVIQAYALMRVNAVVLAS
jgi:hypothetical protein